MNVHRICNTLSRLVSEEAKRLSGTPDHPPAILPLHTHALQYLGDYRSIKNVCGNLRWDFSLDKSDSYSVCVGNRALLIDPKTHEVVWILRGRCRGHLEYPDSPAWREIVAAAFYLRLDTARFALLTKRPTGKLAATDEPNWEEFPEGMATLTPTPKPGARRAASE